MPRPVIGVTCSAEGGVHGPRATLNLAYLDAIFAAGGLPQPIPLLQRLQPDDWNVLLDNYDGLLFTGGDDLDPTHYGQSPHPRTGIMHPRRSEFEIEFFRHADAANKPILSICLGCQIAAVARGGCLIQHVDDLPDVGEVQHHAPNEGTTFHDVEISADSMLARIVGRTKLEVNSRHHQTVDRSQLGGNLQPIAFSIDGVVEAVEDPAKQFFLAVQWHPEDLIDRPEHLRIFEALVSASRPC